MQSLSIRQPWAWLIIHGGKDIENRTWPTKFRGRFLVHAAKGMTRQEYADARTFARARGMRLPPFDQLQRGGIIGEVELVDITTNQRSSPWFVGPIGFVLRKPIALPFQPCKGSLGFFKPQL